MNKQQLLDNVRTMIKGLAVIDMHKKSDFIGEELVRFGVSKADLDLILDHVNKEFEGFGLETMILQEATTDYLQSVTTILRHIKMAEGYEAMGDINTNITKEDFHLEDEVSKGEIVNGKVDSTESEGSNKEA